MARYLVYCRFSPPIGGSVVVKDFYECIISMHGLFYSVTATFTTLVFALFLFVSEQFTNSTSEFYNAPQTRAHAIRLLETLRKDVQHMILSEDVLKNDTYSCQVNVTRNGRTRIFTFPTLRQTSPDEEPRVVQVTYELEGLAQQVKTRNGNRDLFRLSRILDNGIPRSIPAQSSNQIVDFLIELIPASSEKNGNERIVSGGCPAELQKVYVEFHVAIQESTKHINISRYSTTIDREYLSDQPS